MRRATALLLGILLPLLGLSGIGQAQSSVQVQGSIQSVDCQTNTVVLTDAGGSNTIAAAEYTPVLINSTNVPFCTLQQYIGAPATAWLVANNSQFVAVRIDITGPPAAAYAPPAPVVVAPAPLPIAGIVLGTIVVAGLVYLLVRDHDGHFYRYPYYGSYYHYYYRPEYRPYLGPYPVLAPVIVVPAPIAGIVLGTVIVAGLEYLFVRDHDGHFYRYPYYGPYRGYYYRPEYRRYQGPYRDAPVREGEGRWDAPRHQGGPVLPSAPASHGPTFHGPTPSDVRRDAPASHDPARVPVQAPASQGGPQWNRPAHPDQGPTPQGGPQWNRPARPDTHVQGNPANRDSGGRAPVPQNVPRPAPTYHQPADLHGSGNPPAHQSGHREDAPRHRQGDSCGGRGADQGCSGDHH